MGFKVYKNGAWEDAGFVKRYDTPTSAWVDCNSSHTYKNGAWEEDWTSMPCMTLNACTTTNGQIELSCNDTLLSFYVFEDYQSYGSLDGTGYISFAIEGPFTSGTEISVTWQGGFNYWNTNYTACYKQTAGTLRIMGGYDSGTSVNLTYAAIVPASTVGSSSMEYGYGVLTTTLSKAYDKIIIKFTPNFKTGSAYWSGSLDAFISDVFIDGQEYKFPKEVEKYSKQLDEYN